MNMLLMADTRPRMRSGVSICTNECRTTTLMQSQAPATANAATER